MANVDARKVAARRARVDAAKARYLTKMRQKTVYLTPENHDYIVNVAARQPASFVSVLNHVVDVVRRRSRK